MTDRGRKRGGGRAARQASLNTPETQSVPYITRKVPVYEVLDEEGLALIEANAETILQEVGVEFRGDAEALELWKDAGADINGERVRIPKGLCKKLIQQSAPAEFTQHARNPARSVRIGGKNMVLAPAYGSPFVRDLEKGRVTQQLKILKISSSSHIRHLFCIIPEERFANRLIYRLTNGISTWFIRTCVTVTNRSWVQSQLRNGRRIQLIWPRFCLVKNSCVIIRSSPV